MGLHTIRWCLLVTSVVAAPRTYDQRQDGNSNYRGDIENIFIGIFQPQELIQAALTVLARNAPTVDVGFIRPENSPYRVDLEKSNQPVIQITEEKTENEESVDGHKTVKKVILVPKAKTDEETIQQELKPEIPKKEEQENKEVIKKDVEKKKEDKLDKKEVKEEKKNEKNKVENETKDEKRIESDQKKEESVKKDEKKKEDNEKKDEKKKIENDKKKVEAIKKGEKEELMLVGEAIEQCGPDGERDAAGKCVYKSS